MKMPGLCILFCLSQPLLAGGVHGPNGEHLDMPAAVATEHQPQLETHSELFELVAMLQAKQLVIYLDDYLSNQPIADAQLDIELEQLTASAVWNAAAQHYEMREPELLQALQRPGQHTLLFTIQTEQQADLLDGLLEGPHTEHTHEHGHAHEDEQEAHAHWSLPLTLSLLLLLFVSLYVFWLRKSNLTSTEDQA